MKVFFVLRMFPKEFRGAFARVGLVNYSTLVNVGLFEDKRVLE